jgi:5-methylcytosine-specific restriction endonuclease McrA
MLEEIREYALDKTCKICGSTFHSTRKTSLYCSDRCRHRANERMRDFRHYYHVKYGELYLEHYDPSITLKKLYERDGGVCQICGEPCDWNDTEWGSHGPTYPSIDHIVPRAKGGEHKWSNVQLAHCICNSRKRDLMGDELQEVMLNAS